MQYQPAGPPAAGPPLYAPTPLLQPVHPTPFYIEDILGRGAPGPPPPPSLPSPNSSFTSLVASYRSPVYEPTPLHPAFSHHHLAAAAYGAGPYGTPAGSPLYPFPRAVGDYPHALLRHDHLGSGAAEKDGASAGRLARLGCPTPLGVHAVWDA
ncbi:UNVERIFIED_CONTAM: hypothetical protein K2H54_034415 [Gekko kuhli]